MNTTTPATAIEQGMRAPAPAKASHSRATIRTFVLVSTGSEHVSRQEILAIDVPKARLNINSGAHHSEALRRARHEFSSSKKRPSSDAMPAHAAPLRFDVFDEGHPDASGVMQAMRGDFERAIIRADRRTDRAEVVMRLPVTENHHQPCAAGGVRELRATVDIDRDLEGVELISSIFSRAREQILPQLSEVSAPPGGQHRESAIEDVIDEATDATRAARPRMRG